MKKVVLFLFVIFSSLTFLVSPAIAENEALFSPGEGIKEFLLKEMAAATSTLELAIHELTSVDLAQALLKAKQRGVKVRIITDSKQAKGKSSLITYLIRQGMVVKVIGGKEKGTMNHRFAIFDGKRVVIGSFDWTETSAKWNYENVLNLGDSEVVASYQKEFERLWREKRVIK